MKVLFVSTDSASFRMEALPFHSECSCLMAVSLEVILGIPSLNDASINATVLSRSEKFAVF